MFRIYNYLVVSGLLKDTCSSDGDNRLQRFGYSSVSAMISVGQKIKP